MPAFALGRSYGWIDDMFVWDINSQQVAPPADELFPFGIIRPDGSPRPVPTALQWP